MLFHTATSVSGDSAHEADLELLQVHAKIPANHAMNFADDLEEFVSK